MEQGLRAISLEQPYLMADCRWRDAKLGGRFLEAHVPCCRLEGT